MRQADPVCHTDPEDDLRPHSALVMEQLSDDVIAAIAAAAPDCELLRDAALAGRVDVVFAPAAPLDGLARLRALDPVAPIVAVAAAGDVDTASAVVHAGASDLLVLGPQLGDRIRTVLRKLAPVVRLREENQRLRGGAEPVALLGGSAAMRRVREQIARVARVPRPVLVIGERGSGKELVAQALHAASGVQGPLVVVNCAAFADALLETELFGHERGAYTGADRRVAGRFELAHGGTLFLDEVATMSLAFQQKVLRVVEYGVFTRVGGTSEIRTTARVVAATNAVLDERIASGAFLPDLYDRLAFEVIRVPPLRERPDDVPALAAHFLARFAREVPEIAGRTLSASALRALAAYPFPGNVRELKHLVERAAYRGDEGPIDASDLGLAPPGEGGTLEQRVDAFRRAVVVDALREADGNQAAAARALGTTYDQLRHWVRKYGLATGRAAGGRSGDR
ncbi:MAG: sigma 54-interacting transcriptional regulator [Myxococcota bacterium]